MMWPLKANLMAKRIQDIFRKTPLTGTHVFLKTSNIFKYGSWHLVFFFGLLIFAPFFSHLKYDVPIGTASWCMKPRPTPSAGAWPPATAPERAACPSCGGGARRAAWHPTAVPPSSRDDIGQKKREKRWTQGGNVEWIWFVLCLWNCTGLRLWDEVSWCYLWSFRRSFPAYFVVSI